jgi:hypothetical protein
MYLPEEFTGPRCIESWRLGVVAGQMFDSVVPSALGALGALGGGGGGCNSSCSSRGGHSLIARDGL